MTTGQGPKSSFGQRLAALHAQQKQSPPAKSVGELLTDAQEGLLYSDVFFRAMGETDALGIAYLRNTLGYPLPKATKAWHEKPWKYQVEFLEGTANGSGDIAKTAQHALATIQEFATNDLLYKTLQTVIEEIGRPSRRIFSEAQFTNFLGELVFNGLAMRLQAAPGWRKAFKMNLGDQIYWYAPTNVAKARLAWPFVVRALGRIRTYGKIQEEVMPKIKPLMENATLDSDPEQQNLHKLITFPQQVGSLVIWDITRIADRDKEGRVVRDGNGRVVEKNAGLLAILLGRSVPHSNLVLEDWVAEEPLSLPQGESYELPPLLVYTKPDQSLEVGFEQTQLTRDERQSVNRIRRLIWRGIGQEGKFRIPELGPARKAES